MTQIRYTFPENENDLKQMLSLQNRNLEINLDTDDLFDQGFVTARHSLELLTEMNKEGPHIIAKDGPEVIGYALVMTETFKRRLPILVPMFEEIRATQYLNKGLGKYRYFVMGQVCIDKPYRGSGVFNGLYQNMRKRFQNDYDLVITEIAQRNRRSIRAHHKVGFETIHHYRSAADQEDWVLVVWDWN